MLPILQVEFTLKYFFVGMVEQGAESSRPAGHQKNQTAPHVQEYEV